MSRPSAGRPDRNPTRREVVAGLAGVSGAALVGSLGCRATRSTCRGTDQELALLDLRSAADAVKSGEVSPVDLAWACLDRIGLIRDGGPPSLVALAIGPRSPVK